MKAKAFGALVATAVASLIGSTGTVQGAETTGTDTKGCYRKTCGQSVKGHLGTCAGTAVDALKDEKECVGAGGVWVTAAEADRLKATHGE